MDLIASGSRGVALWLGAVIASWLGMQIVHEAGHVIGALATGGRVTHVELRPWTISRTDVEPNPHPLIERWSGPVVGCLLPLAGWLVVRALQPSWAYLLRFFAGFCLIANGSYLGAGAMWPVGDAADILRLEPSRWPLVAYGLVAVTAGLALWHRLGAAFGLGRGGRGGAAWLRSDCDVNHRCHAGHDSQSTPGWQW